MKKNTEYIIPYEGLKQGQHTFEFKIADEFFDSFETEHDFKDVKIHMNVDLMKDTTMLIFNFNHKGTAHVTCDRCLAEIPQVIEGRNKLIVKFGDNSEDDNESIVTLPEAEYEIDLAPFIYDYIFLSFPWRSDCSELEESEKPCDMEVLKKMNDLQADNKENKPDDPRWDVLKKLK